MTNFTTLVFLTTLVSLNIITALSFPLLHKKRVTLRCLNEFMLLKINLQDIPKIQPSSLHLRHFSCKPHHVTNTTAIFRVPYQGCGTTRENKDSYITFSNAVSNSLALNGTRAIFPPRAFVSRAPELSFPFTCFYRQRYMISIKEGGRPGTGNFSGEKQTFKGHTLQSSSVANTTSSNGKVMLHYYHSVLPTLLVLVVTICS